MTDTPPPFVIKQNVFYTVYMGTGDQTSVIPGAKIGDFYLDADGGTMKYYDGSQWADASGLTVTL